MRGIKMRRNPDWLPMMEVSEDSTYEQIKQWYEEFQSWAKKTVFNKQG